MSGWQNLINSKGPPANNKRNDNFLVPKTPRNSLFPMINSPQRINNDKRNPRVKVRLQPGHSPLDWASLKTSGKNLRNIDPADFPLRVTKAELSRHNTKEDCWTVIKGKVYNLTPYLSFHPGGIPILMKCAGIDGTNLFNQYHAWVNAERILDGCFIGFYVS